ncbi:hypothetical protein [Xanthomonas translucens]|uniref:hypothetical protein n=1 Tax=Xanthomonas campestris pv. translucens TaxID=343 RepID=UPI00083A1991|nr:hypothetical protein [Xanthomonas translucens]
MSIKAKIFQPAKASELKKGTLYTIEKQWYMRGQLRNKQGQLIEYAIPLTPGAEYLPLGDAEPCLAVASPHSFECRVIGPIQGPGMPLPASLTWTVAGEVVYTLPVSEQSIKKFITFTGDDKSTEVNTREAFFASHWGVWVLGAEGSEVSRDPLFVIGADA